MGLYCILTSSYHFYIKYGILYHRNCTVRSFCQAEASECIIHTDCDRKIGTCGTPYPEKGLSFFCFILWQLLLPDPNFCWEQLLCRFCSDLCVNTYLFPFYYFSGLPEARYLMVLCGEYNYVFIILRWRERKFYAVKQADQLGFSV